MLIALALATAFAVLSAFAMLTTFARAFERDPIATMVKPARSLLLLHSFRERAEVIEAVLA